MNKLRRYGAYFSAYFFWAMYALTTPVYATATSGNAVQDIMNDDRFQGAISSIEWITGQIDRWFTVIITATAFFIISAALLKNACAGAYCSNHKFWDKVAEAHEKSEALSIAGIKDYFTGKQFMQTTGGGLRDALLCLVPNIKAFTDFDDADIEPKQYFMKAIPQMLVCVIIGVFIYNGYYRDSAATVGSFGSELCNRLFASVDPASFVDKLTETTKTPDNIFAGDPTLQGKDAYKISSEIYKVILSNSKGLTEEDAKESVMRDSEAWAYSLVTNSGMTSVFYNEDRQFDFTVSNLKVTVINQPPAGYSGEFSHPTVMKLNEDVGDEWSVTAYQPINGSTATGYMTEGHNYIMLSCVMKGSAKDTSNKGTTALSPSSGNWNAAYVGTITITVPTSNAEMTKNAAGVQTYTTGNIDIMSLSPNTQISAAISSYCNDNDLSMDSASLVIESWSGYNAGSGQKPALKFNNAQAGSTINCKVSVTFKAKKTNVTSDNEDYSTMRMEVPIQFILGGQQAN